MVMKMLKLMIMKRYADEDEELEEWLDVFPEPEFSPSGIADGRHFLIRLLSSVDA